MRILLLLFSLFISTCLAAQADIYIVVAEDICRCLEESETTGGGQQAQECLMTSISDFRQELRQALDLPINERINHLQLTELLLEPLVENCPLLETLFPMTNEVEYRWSDNPANSSTGRITTPKIPKADPQEDTTTEAPAQWQTGGRLLARPGKGTLRLETDFGEVLHFELPPRTARGEKLVVGGRVELLYRREWRTTSEGGMIVRIITEVK